MHAEASIHAADIGSIRTNPSPTSGTLPVAWPLPAPCDCPSEFGDGWKIETPTNESKVSSLYSDVSDDRNLTALDTLQVINAFARLVRDGESEAASLTLLLDLDQFSIVAKLWIASDKPELNDAFSVPAPREMVPENTTIDAPTSTVATIDEVMTRIGNEDDETQEILRLSLEMERCQ